MFFEINSIRESKRMRKYKKVNFIQEFGYTSGGAMAYPEILLAPLINLGKLIIY